MKEGDPLGEAIQAWVKARVRPDGPMEQKELAERSGQPLYRVHRYVKGDMAGLSLTFLDAILTALGTDLVSACKGALPKSAKPPASDVSAAQRAVLREMAAMDASQQKLVVQLARGLSGHGRRQVR